MAWDSWFIIFAIVFLFGMVTGMLCMGIGRLIERREEDDRRIRDLRRKFPYLYRPLSSAEKEGSRDGEAIH